MIAFLIGLGVIAFSGACGYATAKEQHGEAYFNLAVAIGIFTAWRWLS